jgi:hypothetical protein
VKRVEVNEQQAIGPAPAPAEPVESVVQPAERRAGHRHIGDTALLALLVGVQFAWLALLVYVLFWAL